MRDSGYLRQAVDHARRRHEDMAYDRLLGDGQLGDNKLMSLLVVSYPTVAGHRN